MNYVGEKAAGPTLSITSVSQRRTIFHNTDFGEYSIILRVNEETQKRLKSLQRHINVERVNATSNVSRDPIL